MRILNIIALTLVIVGGINWGLIGLFRFDLVAAIFGQLTSLSRIVYDIVGIAALYCFTLYRPVTSALADDHRTLNRQSGDQATLRS